MKMRYGLHLLIGLVVLFGITVPIAIFMVLGYRIDLDSKKLVATGTLVVQTSPKDALIKINGEIQDKKTPATLRYVLPGEYEMTLEKEGYSSFTKRITIHPRQVSSPQTPGIPIVLFFKSPEKTGSAQGVMVFSPDQKTSVAIKNDRLDLSQNGTIRTYDLNQTILKRTDATWKIEDQKNQASVVLVNDNRFLLRQSTSTATDITNLLGRVKILKTAVVNDENLVVLGEDRNIYKYDAGKKTVTLILNNIDTFTLTPDNTQILYAISNQVYSASLSTLKPVLIRDLETQNNISEIEIIPAGDIYAIARDELFRITANTTQRLGNRVQGIKWYPSSQQLLIYNHNAVWIFEPSIDSQPRLVVRMNGAVSKPLLAPKIGYLFFMFENGIKSAPLDPVLQSESIDVLKDTPLMLDYWVDADGKQISVLSRSNVLDTLQIR